jgi:hypothetical protein
MRNGSYDAMKRARVLSDPLDSENLQITWIGLHRYVFLSCTSEGLRYDEGAHSQDNCVGHTIKALAPTLPFTPKKCQKRSTSSQQARGYQVRSTVGMNSQFLLPVPQSL